MKNNSVYLTNTPLSEARKLWGLASLDLKKVILIMTVNWYREH